MARDQGEWDHARARDKSESDDPFVADGVDVGTNEYHSDDQVREREPISAVSKKRIMGIRNRETLVDFLDPR